LLIFNGEGNNGKKLKNFFDKGLGQVEKGRSFASAFEKRQRYLK